MLAQKWQQKINKLKHTSRPNVAMRPDCQRGFGRFKWHAKNIVVYAMGTSLNDNVVNDNYRNGFEGTAKDRFNWNLTRTIDTWKLTVNRIIGRLI